jgi:hypothetical protein
MNPFLLIILAIDSLRHFMFSACAGFMAFYATWIIYWYCGRVDSPLPWRIWPTTRDDRSIYLACWCGALLASTVAHNWWDKLL